MKKFKRFFIGFISSLFILAIYTSCDPTISPDSETSSENTSTEKETNGNDETNSGNIVHVTSVTVSKINSEAELSEGKTLQLTVTVLPENATNKNVTWSSSDKTKASVNSNGLVSAIKTGSVTITATSKENSTKQGSITLTILPAEAPVTGELEYELSADETYYILKGIGTYTGSVLNIPDTYNSKPVKEIAAYAFSSNNSITSITIPESIEKIGNSAFRDCNKVSQIIFNAVSCEDFDSSYPPFYKLSSAQVNTICIIGNKVEKLPDYLFASYSSSISSLIFEDNSSVKTIGTYIINNNKLISELVIPASTESIKNNAFTGLSGVESIKYYPQSCNLDKYWFTNYVYGETRKAISYYCGSTCREIPDYFAYEQTVKSFVCDGEIEKIGQSAFYESTLPAVFSLPSTVTEIGKSAFESAAGPDELTITIPKEVKIIGEKAFHNVKQLSESVTLSAIETLGNYAFSYTNIKSIDFGDKLATIPSGVVSSTPIETIRIGKAVTKINYDAFDSCQSINKIMIYGDIEDGKKDDYTHPSNKYQLLNVNKNNDYSKNIEVVIGSNVTKVPAYLFYNDSTKNEGRIGSITFEQADNGEETSLTIGEYAFYAQNNIASLEIPSRCTIVGKYSFSECSGITQLTINAKTVEQYAFTNCSAQSVSIGNEASEIHLNYLSSLKSIYYNAKDASFRTNNLASSSEPIEITIGKDVENIQNDFMNSYGTNGTYVYISKITFEANSKLKSMGTYFLSGCDVDSVHELVLPDSVENADLGWLKSLNYLYVGKNMKAINAVVQTTVNDKVPFIDFNAEEYSDASNKTSLTCSETTRIRIGKDVKLFSECLFRGTKADIIYFEEGSICSEIKNNAFLFAEINILVIPSSLSKIGKGIWSSPEITSIYSEKTSDDLKEIENWTYFSNQSEISKIKIYYYNPTNSSGCWHYGDDGIPTLW